MSPKRIVTAAAVASFVDGIDLGLFSISFKALEEELHFAPDKLGTILLCGGLAGSLSSILWGTLADRMDRRRLLSFTTACLGAVTLCTSAASSFSQFLFLQMLTGFFVAAATPVAQSLISENVDVSQRGSAFSILGMCSGISASAAASLAGAFHWRTAYCSMGLMTLTISLVIRQLLPVSSHAHLKSHESSLNGVICSELDDVSRIFGIATFKALLLGGMVGCIPWNALHFFMLYLQNVGFNAGHAASLMMCMSVGKIIGSFLGGNLGDAMARRWPNHGRACLAQISILLGMASLSWLLLGASSNRSFRSFAAGTFVFGVTAVWANPGVDRPLWSELVPSRCHGKIIAWWVAVAFSFGCIFGGPAVGWMSVSLLGYHPGSSAGNAGNAHALAQAIALCTMAPWTLCFFCYSAIHWTYPADRQRLSLPHSGTSLIGK